MRNALFLLAIGALGGSSAFAGERNAIPPAEPAGKPVDCIALSAIRSTQVHGDSTIDFTTSGNRVYRNTLSQSCPGLGFEQRFFYNTSLTQLCSVDVITVLHSPGLSPGATCGLGRFQPVQLSKAISR